MTDHDPLQTLWTQQKQETFTMTAADLQQRSARFSSTIRRRNIVEYAAAALIIGVFGWMAWLIPVPVVKVGAVLLILGALYVCWKLHTLAGASNAQDAAVPLADFHRAELLRQRNALASVWSWYLAPFVPGVIVFVGGVMFSPDTGLPFMAQFTVFAAAMILTAFTFGVVWWLNQQAVKALDKQIAELDRAGE